MDFFVNYGSTLIVGGVMLGLFILAVVHTVKTKKKGGCSGCPGCDGCCHGSCDGHRGNTES